MSGIENMAAPMNWCSLSFHLKSILKLGKYTVFSRNITYMKGNRNVLELHERQIFQTVFPPGRSPELYNKLKSSSQTFYCGFDPTADSLHIGNLLAIIALLHCQRAGHQVIALLGGATGQIGDPSGKAKDRKPMDLSVIERNVISIKDSLERIFTNHLHHFCVNQDKILPAKVYNNRDWYVNYNVVEFLSTVGRNFRMGNMLAKDSVKSRLVSSEGMSWTEFSYQVFQSYDWLHLYQNHKCNIQVGGNDQLGNISAGYELIQRAHNKEVFGLTVPLVTTSTGDKLGKTAGNAVWLNADKTSPYELYQFYINVADTDVEKFLNQFTFISAEDIAITMRKHKMQPEKRLAQTLLAENVTLLVHGAPGVDIAKRSTEALFSKKPEALVALSQEEMQSLFKSAPTCEILLEPGTTLFDTVMNAGCFGSVADAERIIKAGGVYVNHQRESNPDTVLLPGHHILPNHITLIRVGKKNHYLVKWIGAGIL